MVCYVNYCVDLCCVTSNVNEFQKKEAIFCKKEAIFCKKEAIFCMYNIWSALRENVNIPL